MVIRLVELSIQKDKLSIAKNILADVAPKVRNSPGCRHLRILMDLHNPSRITTYSHWNSEADLNAYRTSDVFKNFWTEIKPLFAVPAKAWSSESLHHLP